MERWAGLRREHFVRGVSIKELMCRTGLARNTIRAALRSEAPPGFRCPERSSKLDPFKDEIHDLLRGDPKLTGVRVRELIEPFGFDGGKSIVDDYLREVRPLFVQDTHASTDRLIGRERSASVGSVGDLCACPGRSWPDPLGVGRGLLLGLFTRWRGGADLLEGGTGRAVGHGPLFVVDRRVAAADGLGS